ncbi:MAG TPA: hypothetical protein PLT65_01870 [Bacilli bacterium]|nr:hypothetical protein [Bacilli bacterium]
MFYEEKQAIEACKEDPLLIFEFIKSGYKELVDKILSKGIIDINTKDSNNDDVLANMLFRNWYDLVSKYMKSKDWNVNNQNKDGNTFAHALVTKNYLDVLPIVNQILKNNDFMPNIVNKNGETILDKSINSNYITISVKILEDERFNNIDLVSFRHLYDNYIKNRNYGKYSKLNNLEVIVDNLLEKDLNNNIARLINMIANNYEVIKDQVLNNKLNLLDGLVKNYIESFNN